MRGGTYLGKELDILLDKEVLGTGSLEFVLNKILCIVQGPLDQVWLGICSGSPPAESGPGFSLSARHQERALARFDAQHCSAVFGRACSVVDAEREQLTLMRMVPPGNLWSFYLEVCLVTSLQRRMIPKRLALRKRRMPT